MESHPRPDSKHGLNICCRDVSRNTQTSLSSPFLLLFPEEIKTGDHKRPLDAAIKFHFAIMHAKSLIKSQSEIMHSKLPFQFD